MEYLKIDIFAWKRLKLLTATILNKSTMQYSLMVIIYKQKNLINTNAFILASVILLCTEDTTGVFYKVCLDETCGILSW